MKLFTALSESPLKVNKIAVYRFLISFLVPELLRFEKLPKNWYENAQSWINQSKLIKSVTSCDGHLIRNNPKIYYVSANTCLNYLKL